MTRATAGFKNQQLSGSSKTTEHRTEQFLKYFYSQNNSPEKEVRSAIEKIEANLKNDDESATRIVLPEKPKEAPVMILKNPEPLKEKYRLLQQWMGTILEVHKDYFISQLHDMSGNTPDEEAEIDFDEISERDMYLIKPGAFFYWNIGYHESKSGQRTRSSLIIFRRLPAWTEKEIERSRKKSEDICVKLGWGMDASNHQKQSNGL